MVAPYPLSASDTGISVAASLFLNSCVSCGSHARLSTRLDPPSLPARLCPAASPVLSVRVRQRPSSSARALFSFSPRAGRCRRLAPPRLISLPLSLSVRARARVRVCCVPCRISLPPVRPLSASLCASPAALPALP